MYSGPPAWKLLASYSLPTNERVSLIVSIFSDHDEVEVIGGLTGEDAQNVIDMVYEVSTHARSPPKDGWVDLRLNSLALSVRR